MHASKLPNIKYKNITCSECGNKLTDNDMYRNNRKLATPFVYDCQACEMVRLKSLLSVK